MTKLVAVIAVASVGAGVVVSSQLAARAASQLANSKVIDRTVSCKVPLTGGIHEVTVSANTGTRLAGKPAVWKYLASIGGGANNGGGGSVQAGNPAAPLGLGLPYPPERLSVNAPPICKTASRIPLSKAGLVPEPVPALSPQDGLAQCFPVGRVIVRVRGLFRSPTSLHIKRDRSGSRLAASGTVTTGYLAVRSASGEPLAYGEVFATGKAKLFVARSCSG